MPALLSTHSRNDNAILLTTVLAIFVFLSTAHAQQAGGDGAIDLQPRLLPPLPEVVEPQPADNVAEAPLTAEPVAVEPSAVEAALPPAAESAPDAATEEAIINDEAEEPITYVWYQPAYWFGPTPWDTAVELGVNGSSGTSESFSIRTGGNVNRESDRHKLALSLYYNNTSADGATTQSNALFDGRRDWLFAESPWSLFALSQVFYDEFQAFDLNVNLNSGLGYDVVKSDAVTLNTSFGAGASREFGGPDEEWTPEAQLGVNYQQTIFSTHKFYAKVDCFPEWENFNRYRILSDIGMEIELSRPSNVSLKLSATDRFDSDPDGVRPHNTNYSVLLLWKL